MNIKITDPEGIFDNHFSFPENKRILFSGKFGSGKTYFLREYFDTRKDTTNTFWLSPVKYSVGQNEDIFEFIKFDLAIRLIAMPEFAPILKEKFGEDLYIHQFLSNKPRVAIDTLAVLMQTIATGTPLDSVEGKAIAIATAVKGIAEKLIKSFEIYNEFKKKIDEPMDATSDILKKYLEESTLKKGSIFEDDLVTQTIRSALDICKIQSERQNVLIIDDFDRLDPEHVFRILNILSVHNDMYDDANKFGFDKVIVVCDYDNIVKIYAHKYGTDISFLGYISKFFSMEVFHFNNRPAIQAYCKEKLRYFTDNENVGDLLGLILSYFIENNYLTIRDIVKVSIPFELKSIKYGPYSLNDIRPSEYLSYSQVVYKGDHFIKNGTKEFYVSSDDYPFIYAIRMLCIVFSDYSTLRKVILEIKHDVSGNYPKEYIPIAIKALMPLLHHAYNVSEVGKLLYNYSGDAHHHSVYVDHPINTIFGHNLPILTGWHSGNKYDGTCSYYKNVDELMNKADYLKVEQNDKTSYKALFTNLGAILDFLERTDSLQQLGISK